jgi:cathepsin F
MKVVVLVVTLLFACAFAKDELDLFTDFIKEYNKAYDTVEEWTNRFNIFKENLARIDELNRMANGDAVYGINQFADMTPEEFGKYPCGGVLNDLPELDIAINTEPRIIPEVRDVPDEFDWTQKGAVTPVKNQGSCGSCWAFSTIANIEGAWFLAGHPLTSLAEGEVVDCTTTSYGCSGGWPYWAMTDLLKSPYNGQVDTEESYPYVAKNMKCTFTTDGVGATISNYTSYCRTGTTPCTESDIQNLLMTKGPLSICLNARTMEYYRGGVDSPTTTTCNPASIDHCVTMVGWGVDSASGKSYWKIKNSWGTTWGEQGFYRLVRGTSDPRGACGVNTVVTAATI